MLIVSAHTIKGRIMSAREYFNKNARYNENCDPAYSIEYRGTVVYRADTMELFKAFSKIYIEGK